MLWTRALFVRSDEGKPPQFVRFDWVYNPNLPTPNGAPGQTPAFSYRRTP